LSWLIFSYWWLSEYSYSSDSVDGWLFLSLFFALFYVAFIGHQFFSEKPIPLGNIILLTINAFIFYGIGMDFLESADQENFQGLFTIGNGLIHLFFSIWAIKKWADKKLFYVLFGLFMTFLTIAIPVQFEGDTIPVLWLGEAIILFYIARRFSVIQYEFLSYITLFLAEAALIFNWVEHYYDSIIHHSFLWNEHFLTSTIVITGLVVLNIINKQIKVDPKEYRFPLSIGNAILPAILVGIIYFSFFNEIYHYFDQSYLNSEKAGEYNYAIRQFGMLWLINYTFLFLTTMGLLNYRYWKNSVVDFLILIPGTLVMVFFLTQGMLEMNAMRDVFLIGAEESDSGYIWIRYVCYFFTGLLLSAIFLSINRNKAFQIVERYFPLAVYFIILVFLSNELTTVMQLVMGIEMESLAHKVGYSILWGVYALVMIGIGFWKKSSQLRIGGIVLFAVTLLKVFLIDLQHISTISRMVVFIALGILMLVISYLYQRFKNILLDED